MFSLTIPAEMHAMSNSYINQISLGDEKGVLTLQNYDVSVVSSRTKRREPRLKQDLELRAFDTDHWSVVG